MYLTQSDGVLLKIIGWEREELIKSHASVLYSGMALIKVLIILITSYRSYYVNFIIPWEFYSSLSK